jgi:predicted aconitase with swiveling domain
MGGVIRQISGQVVVAGEGIGPALVTDQPLSFWGGLDAETGEVIDRHHPLSGKNLAGRVLVLPHGRGSCSASGVLLEAIRNGTAPAAIITARVDPIIGLGAILGDELYGKPVPVVVVAPDEIAWVGDGDWVAVGANGSLQIEKRSMLKRDSSLRSE